MFSRLFGGDSKSFGKDGEELAARYLSKNGYRILERNCKSASCELDIVAMDGETLVFVEVKSRRTGGYGRPEESVDYRKQRQLTKAALAYIAKNRSENMPCRFDVVAITARAGSQPEVDLISDAFELTGGYQ